MRVVHLIKVVAVAGAERHLLMLLAGLRARGVDASILLLVEPRRPMDEFVRAAEARGIPVERLLIRRHVDPTLLTRLRAALARLRPDIVHTHLLHADLYGIPAARLARVPAVVSTRHNDNPFRRRAEMRLVNRLLWRLTDAGIAISGALARFCVDVEGAPPAKIHTIPYGLDNLPDPAGHAARRAEARQKLGFGGDTPLVGVVSRLNTQKGVIYALRAFAQIAPRHPEAQLIIAGDGALRAALQADARRLGIAARTHFLGWRSDIDALWPALDLLLMPSLWEGFGLSLLEAMANAVPVIGSRVSAIPEVIVDGETGRLVPPRDSAALAAALDDLLRDRVLRAHMALVARDRLEEHFTAARMVEATHALYARLPRRR